MARLSFGSGSVRVEMDDMLERLARRAIEDVAPGLLERIEGRVEKIAEDARDRWPVRTGASKAGLTTYTAIVPAGDAVRGGIANGVEHARYVKSWQHGLGGKSAMVELLRKPVRAAARELAADLADTTVKALKGG